MIVLSNCDGVEIVIKPTIFPDGTSQVWKLPTEHFEIISGWTLEWRYENEVELIHFCQALQLVRMLGLYVTVSIPYLPYSRQDKDIDNGLTFAKFTFMSMLTGVYDGDIESLDVHSSELNEWADEIALNGSVIYSNRTRVISKFPEHQLRTLLDKKYDFIVFPDKGAFARYSEWIYENYSGLKIVVLDKVRDQLTGKITGLTVADEVSASRIAAQKFQSNVPSVLIIDDLSDYGGTFKKAAQYLKQEIAHCSIELYVTHFLGHGDYESYKESGIEKIYTSNSLDQYRKQNHEMLEILA